MSSRPIVIVSVGAVSAGLAVGLGIAHPKVWVVVLIFIFGTAATLESYALERAVLKAIFGVREDMSADDICDRYYADLVNRDLFRRVWRECAVALRIPEGKVRPTDAFDKEVVPSDVFASLHDRREDLVDHVRRQYKRRRMPIDGRAIKTVDDAVRLLLRLG